MSDWERLIEVTTELVRESCREELGAEGNWEKCNEPAEFVLWGKLIPPEGLGPRCYDHAAKHVGHGGLSPSANYALMDLRPVQRVLAALSAEPEQGRYTMREDGFIEPGRARDPNDPVRATDPIRAAAEEVVALCPPQGFPAHTLSTDAGMARALALNRLRIALAADREPDHE